MMQRLQKIINKTLSVRLSLMVVMAMAMLLMASMAVMLHYSRKAIKEEAVQKAQQTLEGTVQGLDNILLSVEQATGNLYFTMLPHLNQHDMMLTYCRRLVETNPHVMGCAIAFKPGFYQDYPHFMAYVHHAVDSNGKIDETKLEEELVYDGEYLEQPWYSHPVVSKKPGWQSPMTGDEVDEVPIITFCLPIPDANGIPIGVIGVGMTLSRLSSIVAEAKPSDHSYCTLLDSDGSFIVHPDKEKLESQTAITVTAKESDSSGKKVVEAMLSGETGFKPFRLSGDDYYIFFKPFVRTAVQGRLMEELKWSAGIVYPEDDIFGKYNSLLYLVLAIALCGIIILFLLCRVIIHRQLTPLIMLAEKAQRIAKGHFDEPIPDSHHRDEIGVLQTNFQQMQRSLAANIGELEQLTTQLQENTKGLRIAYNQAQKADRMKTAFLHNMSNQMISPAMAIDNDVSALVGNGGDPSISLDTGQLAEDIRQNGNTITEVLNNLIHLSDEDIRKEVADE
jgi:HAMP domain-containing protein